MEKSGGSVSPGSLSCQLAAMPNVPHMLCCRVHGGQGTARKMQRLHGGKGTGSSLVLKGSNGQSPDGRDEAAGGGHSLPLA